jgi:hypothetical protein
MPRLPQSDKVTDVAADKLYQNYKSDQILNTFFFIIMLAMDLSPAVRWYMHFKRTLRKTPPTPMPCSFALLDICIRNDNSCPDCRKMSVTFYESWDEAYAAASSMDLPESSLAELAATSECWIDEWERRRNGDMYRICPITDGDQWNLQKPSSIDVGKWCRTELQPNSAANYFRLEITINMSEFCPDNFRVKVAFFRTIAEAVHDISNESTEWELTAGEAVWIPDETSVDTDDGTYLQVFPVVTGKRYDLED